jgi:AraC-like DNA-binding protein
MAAPLSSEVDSERGQQVTIHRARCSFGEFDFLRGRGMRQAFPPHFHDSWAVGLIDEGAHRLQLRREALVVPPRSVVVIQPGEVHTGEPIAGGSWSYRMLYLPPLLIRQITSFSERIPSMVRRHDRLFSAIDRVCRAALDSGSLRELDDALITLSRALDTLAEDGASSGRSIPAVGLAAVRAFVATHHRERIRLEALADLAGLGPFQLLRMFRRAYGLTPHAYLRQVRLLEARALLSTGAPISTIAYQAGFSDQSHLTRLFKDFVGVTPGAYAAATRGQAQPMIGRLQRRRSLSWASRRLAATAPRTARQEARG